jgi:S-adenosylmethionine/arginine decarboxylase-like enzyme
MFAAIAGPHYDVRPWSGYGYAAIDFFTTRDNIDLRKGLGSLKERTRAEHVPAVKVKRGQLDVTGDGIARKASWY